MTDSVDIVNRALQVIGTRTTVTQAELDDETSNEAIQANLILVPYRDQLTRMAPWNCSRVFNNLTYITSQPGTPENTSPATTQWERGQPPPPWAYEYQYPVDCVRPLYIVPQFITGFASGVPITTAVTGNVAPFWQGPPVKFAVATDLFYPVTAAAVAAGGSGYAVGDIITLDQADAGDPPVGAPAQLRVATVAAGAVATVTVVNQIWGSSSNQGGSYFELQTGVTWGQASTTGSGTGATFTLTQGAQGQQRVILTNQESALCCYLKRVTDPNVMDEQFVEAWVRLLGAGLCKPLSGDQALAKQAIIEANQIIVEARKADGNEGLTINDVTPDFIRQRGIDYTDWQWGPNYSYDYGPLWANPW